jgi:hypothetical protein
MGTITRMDPRSGEITARLDAAGKDGREVRWSAAEFEGFRHGYAGTIYKGQGKTLDRTYLYHTEHWRSAASYVALTRQRESAEVFVARETARDAGQLARQMGRGEVRAASIAWPTRDELTQEQKRAVEREEWVRDLRDVLTDGIVTLTGLTGWLEAGSWNEEASQPAPSSPLSGRPHQPRGVALSRVQPELSRCRAVAGRAWRHRLL